MTVGRLSKTASSITRNGSTSWLCAQGIAHFLEHMLFMGTEKYPDENEYSKFLAAHGGSSNAYTAAEDTVTAPLGSLQSTMLPVFSFDTRRLS